MKTTVVFEGNHAPDISTPMVSNVHLPVTNGLQTIYLWIVTTNQINVTVLATCCTTNYTGILACNGVNVMTINQASGPADTWNINIYSSIYVRKLEYVILNDYLQ